MVERLGYRRILPLANIVLFAILIAVGYLGTAPRSNETLEFGHSAQAEGWQPTYLERPAPLTHLFAWSLNFPAMLFATPFGLLTRGAASQWLVNGIGAMYLLVQWFMVGLWLDRRRDRSQPVRASTAFTAIRWTALLLAVGAFLVVIALIAVRIAVHDIPETFCTLPMLFWPGFLAYAALWEIAQARLAAQTRSAAA